MWQWWEISGTINVEERLTTRDASGAAVVVQRPLADVAIEVAGWPDDRASFAVWGRARTDESGRFFLRALRPSWAHRLRVTTLLSSDRLQVAEQRCDGLPANGGTVVWEPEDPVDGPIVELGVLAFTEKGIGPLGERDNVRRAITWYLAKTAMSYLESLCESCSFSEQISILYPAAQPSLRAPDPTIRTAPIHRDDLRDDWSVDTVLRQVMLLWSCQCGPVRALWPDEPVNPRDSTPVDRFAEVAKNELFTVIWARPSSFTRRVSRLRSFKHSDRP